MSRPSHPSFVCIQRFSGRIGNGFSYISVHDHMKARAHQVGQALRIEENLLHKRLETALIRLKDQKPELFTVTMQEQVNKLTVEIASSVIRWIIE